MPRKRAAKAEAIEVLDSEDESSTKAQNQKRAKPNSTAAAAAAGSGGGGDSAPRTVGKVVIPAVSSGPGMVAASTSGLDLQLFTIPELVAVISEYLPFVSVWGWQRADSDIRKLLSASLQITVQKPPPPKASGKSAAAAGTGTGSSGGGEQEVIRASRASTLAGSQVWNVLRSTWLDKEFVTPIHQFIELSGAALTGSSLVNVFAPSESPAQPTHSKSKSKSSTATAAAASSASAKSGGEWIARDLDIIAPLTAQCVAQFVELLTKLRPHLWAMKKHDSLESREARYPGMGGDGMDSTDDPVAAVERAEQNAYLSTVCLIALRSFVIG